jgi:hypothetical protein
MARAVPAYRFATARETASPTAHILAAASKPSFASDLNNAVDPRTHSARTKMTGTLLIRIESIRETCFDVRRSDARRRATATGATKIGASLTPSAFLIIIIMKLLAWEGVLNLARTCC